MKPLTIIAALPFVALGFLAGFCGASGAFGWHFGRRIVEVLAEDLADEKDGTP